MVLIYVKSREWMSSCSEEWSFVVDKERRGRMVTLETNTPLEKLKMMVCEDYGVDHNILGLVENMSCFVCPHCNEASFIFGKEGARQMAAKKDLKLIGEIREGSDEGVRVVVSSPGSVVSKAYEDLAQNVVNGLKELRDNPENEIQMKLNVPHSS
ncbi:hypothetical protein Bca4012_098215 [Brassica carinata]|uniref:Uncharacterized protein n=1 Tax=Brassica carinata TaxID=52824 RepID=A0A8X7PE78_BRACI|nr:hypothetical protein Bca52824_080910 [Brassica carinata]